VSEDLVLPATDVVTLGETMALVKAESPGPLAHAPDISLGMGGSESNFAIALSRLGTSVTWIGRVGDDSLGELVLRELRAEGVRAIGYRDPAAPTGLMIRERRTSQHFKVWYYRSGSAGSRLSPADIPADAVQRARLLHISGITPALSPDAAAAVDRAVELAREAGVRISLDVNYRAALWSREQAGAVLRELAARCDVIFAGDDEAAMVVGAGDPAALARRLVELGPGDAVIKLGSAGAFALAHGVEYRRAAVPVIPVDTVGAGDGFVAGYLAELLAGLPPEQRLDTAVRVGAFACLVPGDWEGLPRRSELGLLDSSEPVAR
jgi:2-dehydro-3-deoxygluconokinase